MLLLQSEAGVPKASVWQRIYTGNRLSKQTKTRAGSKTPGVMAPQKDLEDESNCKDGPWLDTTPVAVLCLHAVVPHIKVAALIEAPADPGLREQHR